jgi:hypothetical protein
MNAAIVTIALVPVYESKKCAVRVFKSLCGHHGAMGMELVDTWIVIMSVEI